MAVSIRNLKIRHQILLVTLPPLFVLLCAVALLFYSYWTAAQTGRTSRRSGESIARGEALLRRLTEMFTAVNSYLLTAQPSVLAPYEAAEAEVARDLAALRELEADNPADVAKVDALQVTINRWRTEWAHAALQAVARGDAAKIVGLLVEGEKRNVLLRSQLLRLLEEDKAENAEGLRQSERVMSRMLGLGVGVALLLALVLVLLTRAVTRLISQPVYQLIQASDRVSRGDFNPALPPQAETEFGRLSTSFAHMITALRHEREEMAALNKFFEIVTQCTSEREVYDHVLHSLGERFDLRQTIIFELNQEENLLEAKASLLPLPEEVQPWPVIEDAQQCKAVRMGRPFLVNDVTAEPLCPAKFLAPSEGSYYCGPLIAGGRMIGAVRLEASKDFWTPERRTLLESYLSGAATALSNLRHQEVMKQQATVDALTGLHNRRFLEEYARKAIAGAKRKSEPLGVLMLDLDHFKSFNDAFGHEVGDRILKQFAKTITTAMRQANLAARFGGEEFVLLLPDSGPQACLAVAERIRKAVANMVLPSGGRKDLAQLTVSGGIAVFPEHGQSLEELLQACDKALYESKRKGRNRISLYVEPTEPLG